MHQPKRGKAEDAARNTPVIWDRHAIVAEIRRRGSNLTRLALDAGEPECTCRQALYRCYRKGEWIIADFLRVDPSELWPERYMNAPTGRDTNAKRVSDARANRQAAPDRQAAA